ncbi:YHYH protein [Pseudoduganella sp. LjRoot289]|uniref:YHYH protein n=1 Tax=Pseudoduganella sp. LjRoot289 TaxID=3342314 RepID=UPI003ECD9525
MKLQFSAAAAALAVSALSTLSACGGSSGTGGVAAPAVRLLAGGAVVSNGVSTVVYSGPRSRYTIAASGSGYSVTDTLGVDATTNITATQRLQFSDVNVAFDTNGNVGKAYRLYQAAFNRVPDASGLGYWIAVLDSGVSHETVAQGFVTSEEFKSQYGANASSGTLITAFYTSALHRAPDTDGYNFWVATLAAGVPLATVLTGFSESPENYAGVAALLQAGVEYLPLNRVVDSSVPGAPVIGAATAGDGSASIAFTASSGGGAAATGYVASCSGGGAVQTATGTASPLAVTGLSNGTAYACTVTAKNAAGTGAASASVSVTPAAATAAYSTASVLCPHSASVVNPTNGLTSTVAISCTTTLRTITGTGVPDHAIGTFPNAGNPNTVAAVSVRFSNTLNPAMVSSTGTAVDHILGFANNSVKFDPSTAESYQNAGVWKIEALNQTYFAFGVDSSNAHVQPDGAYHYHGMPEGYITKLGKGQAMTLVGFAVDGFPIYARYGYTSATDAGSAVKVMTASYRMKSTASSGRPSTTAVPMGTFTQDYEYVAGLGDLDECNGRTGVTPEFPNGIYHYYITDGYPYIQRCVKGTAASTTGPARP